MTLRERCQDFLQQAQRRAITQTGGPVDDLYEFVVAEIGRSSDPVLENTNTVVLYFATGQDLNEFIDAMRKAKPNIIARKI